MKILIAGMAALLFSAGAVAQGTTSDGTGGGGISKIGKISVTKFNETNAKGNAMVSAIKPTSKALSAADQKLMMQVAAGGQTQLLLSQAAVDKVITQEAKMLAQSEVEEQTGVSAKLQEIASAKGFTLSATPLPETQPALDKMQGMSGQDIDAFYVKESGVKGHIKLQKTMATVLAQAKDADLKKLAAATLPVISMHLTVSTDVSSRMRGASAKGSGAK
ncbi:MAG: hypothetical protein JWR72_1196 [Flavisolibacter sp.]|nr:hypothetical protein [Flavisolibacter sp.]